VCRCPGRHQLDPEPGTGVALAPRHALSTADLSGLVALVRLGPAIESLLSGSQLPYRINVVTNRDDESAEVVLRVRHVGTDHVETLELTDAWPERVYSLSHVALPQDVIGGNSIDHVRRQNHVQTLS